MKNITIVKVLIMLLQCIGVIFFSALAGWLIWLLCSWITPYLMQVKWWLFILYLILAGGLITGIMASVSNIIGMLIAYLTESNIIAKVLNIPALLIFGFYSVCIPWKLDIEYGVLQYIIGVMLTITYAIMYLSLAFLPFNKD